MALLKQSTARSRVVLMVDEDDHVTGLAGLTLTITASKDGGAFAGISPTVTDLGAGWYKLALTTTHTNTLGDLALHITSTGADPTDLVDDVIADLPGATAPTAIEIADAILERDLGSGTGAGVLDERTVRAALRFLRNKWAIVAGVLTVTNEDDSTTAWTAAVSTMAGDAVAGVDPT